MSQADHVGVEPRLELPRVIERILHHLERRVQLWLQLDVKESYDHESEQNYADVRISCVLVNVTILGKPIVANRPNNGELDKC